MDKPMDNNFKVESSIRYLYAIKINAVGNVTPDNKCETKRRLLERFA